MKWWVGLGAGDCNWLEGNWKKEWKENISKFPSNREEGSEIKGVRRETRRVDRVSSYTRIKVDVHICARLHTNAIGLGV